MSTPKAIVFQGCQLLIGFIALASSAIATAHTCSKVTASAHPNYPPYHWQQNGRLVGASVDIAKKVFDQLGVEFEAVYVGPWKRVLESARASKVDMVLGLKQTPARSEYLTFSSSAMLANPIAVFVKKNSPIQFDEWEELIGLRGVKNAGDRYGKGFDYYASQKLSLVDGYSIKGNFQKLILGRADYFIHSKYAGEAFIRANALSKDVEALPTMVNSGYLHSGFTVESPCAVFNAYLSNQYQQILASGEADRLLQENLQKWLRYQEDSRSLSPSSK